MSAFAANICCNRRRVEVCSPSPILRLAANLARPRASNTWSPRFGGTLNKMARGRQSSLRVVYVAIAANVAIALAKYVAALMTGSAAMLAEAFHSTADSCNEFLLIVGSRRSRRPPDDLHPFGHGKELYFWSLIVALVIFGLGGGLSLHNGISRLLHPMPATNPNWNYVVLGVAAVFEGYSWLVSRRELKARQRPGQSLWRVIRASKDP